MIVPFFARDTTTGPYTCSPENPYCLSTQSNNSNNATTASTTTTDTPRTHALLGHRNLVGVLVIAALIAFALVLSLCFAKWSKPIRRFLRGEPRDDSKRSSTDGGSGSGGGTPRFRFGIGHWHGVAAAPTTTAPSTQQGIPNDAEMASVIPDSSSSSQSSLDLDTIKEKASVKVALPAKVRANRRTPRFWG